MRTDAVIHSWIFFSTISSSAQRVKSIIVVNAFGLACAFLNVSLSFGFCVSQSQHCWGSWSNSPERVWRTRGPSCWKPSKRFVVLQSFCLLLMSWCSFFLPLPPPLPSAWHDAIAYTDSVNIYLCAGWHMFLFSSGAYAAFLHCNCQVLSYCMDVRLLV